MSAQVLVRVNRKAIATAAVRYENRSVFRGLIGHVLKHKVHSTAPERVLAILIDRVARLDNNRCGTSDRACAKESSAKEA